MKTINDVQATTKDLIIDKLIEMIQSGFALEAITIRKIAYKSNVSNGLINYYFETKEQLIYEAISRMLDQYVKATLAMRLQEEKDPKVRLRLFICGVSELLGKYPSYSKIMVENDFLSPTFATARGITHIVREIFPEASEAEVNWTSVMVIAPLQYANIKKGDIGRFIGTKYLDDESMIDFHLKMLGI